MVVMSESMSFLCVLFSAWCKSTELVCHHSWAFFVLNQIKSFLVQVQVEHVFTNFRILYHSALEQMFLAAHAWFWFMLLWNKYLLTYLTPFTSFRFWRTDCLAWNIWSITSLRVTIVSGFLKLYWRGRTLLGCVC